MTQSSDLQVKPISNALQGYSIDVIVSGSIAAVESVRFIRALRRLGAETTPWLTAGGSQFITPLALEWAAAKPCIQSFSGTASHICTADALVVAPASANFIQHIVGGKMATPATALVASALGQGKQVLVLPAMHDSLANSPFYKRNLQTLTELANVTVLRGRQEEGKQKFPDPEILSSEVAHLCNTGRRPKEPILITSGTTRGYIDEIRYVSNYSSGSLGKAVAHELFRQGFRTTIVAGPAEHQAELYTRKTDVKTTREMLDACLDATANSRLLGAIFCASVLDFEPTQRLPGKIPSSSSELTVTMKPNEKIIARVNVSGPVKIGFKLGIDFGQTEAETIAREYMQKYNLTALIANDFRRVNASEHHAWAVTRDGHVQECKSKQEIATWIARCFEQSLASHS